MSDDTTQTADRTTSVHLVRSSNPWTNASSAAGFVLRYSLTVRKMLVTILGSSDVADDCLRLLIAHLVSAGFGENKKGRLRDFLIRAIRSTAKAKLDESEPTEKLTAKIDAIKNDNEQWLSLWRTGLLERAWRSLERKEHQYPKKPLYSVLHCATTASKKENQSLKERLREERGIEMELKTIDERLLEARAVFAQLLADEVAETIETPTKETVKSELKILGLTRAFDGVAVR
ncbi:hypothetical protein Q31b_02130 [Novipirellula aureliae]|uniref:RNA polymerase sigma factor n=1 Tax=Novipirellula aureliae TaxID=2527966 RepID=A0A5C6E7V6_9BACT|nr:hypothetical protein [Novipirellula aureliae]TWU45042.1 hypothetical protein Q31b_02130 [Novipirellula aureliae]